MSRIDEKRRDTENRVTWDRKVKKVIAEEREVKTRRVRTEDTN